MRLSKRPRCNKAESLTCFSDSALLWRITDDNIAAGNCFDKQLSLGAALRQGTGSYLDNYQGSRRRR